MRKLIGPAILVLLAAASLFFLQHHGRQDHQRTPGATATQPASSISTTPPPSSPAPPAAPRSSAPSPARLTDPGPGGVQRDDIGDEPQWTPVEPAATARPRDKTQAARFRQAVRAAARFMKAFARPPSSTSASAWWAGVKPLLSPRVLADYEGTSPMNVPFVRVTGSAVVIPSDAPADLLTVVRVPTDAGAYRVELERLPQGWFVTRAQPAPSPGGPRR